MICFEHDICVIPEESVVLVVLLFFVFVDSVSSSSVESVLHAYERDKGSLRHPKKASADIWTLPNKGYTICTEKGHGR